MDSRPNQSQGGHVIVCGLEGVGLRIVELFHLSGTPVVVVDDDANQLIIRQLETWGVTHIHGSAHFGGGPATGGARRSPRGRVRRG